MLERTRSKLRQAEFFLQLFTAEQARMSRGEAADFNLSAFLFSARAVVASLRQEYPDPYEQWLPRWYLDLSDGDRQLLNICISEGDMMQSPGALEMHLTQANASLGQFPQDFDTQELLLLVGSREIESSRRGEISVPAVCREYLDLLKRLVAEFEHVNLSEAVRDEPSAAIESWRVRTRF